MFDGKLTLAKSLVAIEGNEARTTALERMFIERCEKQPGDELIEQHRKFFFTISSQRDSVLSIAQTLDPSFPAVKLGKLSGLKALNDRKLSLQTKTLEHKQQTGRLVVRDGQQMFSALYDTAKAVVLTEPTDETAVLCEDLLRFSLQLRMNEGCPHTARDDGHKLSMDNFVVQDRICTFKAGSKSHGDKPRTEYGKVCLFDDQTTKGLLKHIFFDGRKPIGNERKTVLSRTQLDKHGILKYITDESDKYTRGKWRGIGASFLLLLLLLLLLFLLLVAVLFITIIIIIIIRSFSMHLVIKFFFINPMRILTLLGLLLKLVMRIFTLLVLLLKLVLKVEDVTFVLFVVM